MNRRNKLELHTILIFGLLIVSLGIGQVSPAKASGESRPLAQARASGIGGFHLISVDQGWLVSDNRLYWTADSGNSWNLISASLPKQSTIAGVDFIDSQEGRVLMVDSAGEDPVYSLGRTHDGGMTWETGTLALFSPGDINAIPDKVTMQWLSPQTGWLVIKRATGINFSIGSLFRTDDGGLTWNQLTIPIGEEVAFITPEIGWVAGGAAGDELYQTVDGGATWVSQDFVQSTGTASQKHAYLLPKFQDVNNGLLPIMITDGNNVRMDFYLTNDGGQSWKLENSTPLDGNVNLSVRFPLTMYDSNRFTMVVPHSNRIVTEQGRQQVSTIYNRDGRSADLTIIEMASMDVGLGLYVAGNCIAQAAIVPATGGDIKGNLSCTQTKQLLKTTDGGETWNPVVLPGITGANQTGNSSQTSASGSMANINYPLASSYSVDTMIGQGVDICDIPTANQMQAWWTDSPYGAVNLYIGGSMRGCQNSRLNSSLVSLLFQQGWKMIPTWVGPQAPCSSFRSLVSSDPDTAYQQGISEADAATTAASNLGLTSPDGSNTVIYYDLEGYNVSDVSCRNAMKSFMDGWDEELAAKGNISGVYGSSCASALIDFSTIAHVPDVIWPAWWNFSTYDSSASVLSIPCLPNSYWSFHQRIHQYAGGHNETWGGVTINVDDDVLDGILAVPYQGSANLPPGQPVNPKPIDGVILSRTNDNWLYWSTNGSSCNVHIWGENIETTTNGNCASLHLGELTPGAYLWQVTAINPYGSMIGLVWHFNIQPYAPTELTLGTVTSTQINLGWTLSTDDPVNLDGYDVYVNNQIVRSLPKGTVSSTISDLSCNTVYSIFLRSRRQNVQSTNSNSVTTTTGSCAGVTYTISGNAGVAGAILSYTDGTPKTATADGNGNYSFVVPYNWSGSVTPLLAGYFFSPISRNYINIQSNQTSQNYSANNSWYGGAVISSDRSVVAVGRPQIGGQVMTYDGYTGGSTTMYLPMLFKNIWGYDSAFYVQNLDAVNPANITLKFYDTNGTLSCTLSDSIPLLSSHGTWVPDLTCLPASWVGGVVVTSNRNIVAVGRPHIGSEITTYNGFSSGSLTMYVPMLFKNMWGYDAALYVQNVDSANAAAITLKFYDTTGNLTCTQTDSIPRLSSHGYWLPDLTCLGTSWVGGVVVTSNRNIVAVGRPHLGAAVTTYDGFASGNSNFYVPSLFKNAAGSFDSALYVQNISPSNAANITLKYYDMLGNLTCTQTDSIPLLSSHGYWLPDQSCLGVSWQGSVKVESSQPVVAVGRPHMGADVASFDGFTGGSTLVYVPMLFKNMWSVYNSALTVQNIDPDNPANITIDFYDVNGILSCVRRDSIPALGELSYWMPDLTCSP